VRLDLTEELVERLAREHHYTGAGLLLDTETLSPGECLRRIDAWIAERLRPVQHGIRHDRDQSESERRH